MTYRPDSLPAAYDAMQQAELEVAFARYFAPRLYMLTLTGDAGDVAFKMALLSPGYETEIEKFSPAADKDRFLKGLAQGNVTGLQPPGILGQAIADAFVNPMPQGELADMLAERKLGEAILRAMILLKDGGFADPGDVTAALATFRAVGLEEEARRTAIQLLLLERRG